MTLMQRLNAWADRIEKQMPPWFHWDTGGDPIGWLHHATWTVAGGALGGLVGLLFGAFRAGVLIGAMALVAFYIVRESGEARAAFRRYGWAGAIRSKKEYQPFQKGPHVGWLVDSVCDVLAPALVVGLGFLLW